MGQALLCILGDSPGSLYDRSLLSDNKVFEYVKDLSLGRTSRNILAPAVKDVILMAQDYMLRVRESLLEFWLASAESVDCCWEMKIWFDKN